MVRLQQGKNPGILKVPLTMVDPVTTTTDELLDVDDAIDVVESKRVFQIGGLVAWFVDKATPSFESHCSRQKRG